MPTLRMHARVIRPAGNENSLAYEGPRIKNSGTSDVRRSVPHLSGGCHVCCATNSNRQRPPCTSQPRRVQTPKPQSTRRLNVPVCSAIDRTSPTASRRTLPRPAETSPSYTRYSRRWSSNRSASNGPHPSESIRVSTRNVSNAPESPRSIIQSQCHEPSGRSCRKSTMAAMSSSLLGGPFKASPSPVR